MTFDGIKVEQISQNDAMGIHTLMTENATRFSQYFPKTLEANRTLPTAKEFAVKKVKEFENNEEFLFVIKDKSVVIGLIYIKELDWQKKQGEYAYCIDKSQKGKGIMTMIVKKLSVHAFNFLKLEVLQIKVHKTNHSSVKVAENAHFQWQRTLLKEYTPPNQSPLDMELYELYNER